MKVSIVGPCAAGKSTLARNLQALGYDAQDCAQEHSGVQTMWQRIARPDLLIYLDVSLVTLHQRLHVDWEPAYLDEQKRRLYHARAHAHFYLSTDDLTAEQVRDSAAEFLRQAVDPS